MKRRPRPKRRKAPPVKRRAKPGPLGYTKRGAPRVRNYSPRGSKAGKSHAAVMREARQEPRDIGRCLSALDPVRHEACRLDLERFLRTYAAATFSRPFSEDQRRVIEKSRRAVMEGGLYSEACYRGFGKTVLLRWTAIWAGAYGHQLLIPLLAATAKLAADELIEPIKRILETNPLLLEDFECIAKPARALEGLPHRCAGQLSDGVPTRIEWGVAAIAFPGVEVWQRKADGSAPTEHSPATSSFARIMGFGLTSSFRGISYTLPDGRTIRPQFVGIDDPQTDASAQSPAQCETREKIITRAVLGLAGHDEPLAAIMPCTIIRKGDMADRILDRSAHPEWQGDVLPMVKSWATHHADLWMGRYAELRRQDLLEEQGGRQAAEAEATKFYEAHRAEMDAGAVVSDPLLFKRGELSGIQHAYNLLIDRGEAAFMAEYQCAPLDEQGAGDEPPLEPRDILAKAIRLPRRVAPHETSTVVAFIDCRKPQLHWAVCAFGAGFRGHLLDVGVRQYLAGGARMLGGAQGALASALTMLTGQLAQAVWHQETGTELRTALVAADSGWESRTIYACLRRSPFAALLVPSKGEGGEQELRKPKHIPSRDHGDQWYYALNRERDARLLVYNVDRWKSFVAERLWTPVGGQGSLTLWGDGDRSQWALAEQLTSERPAPKRRRDGGTFDKWAQLKGRPNHWWDCLVGCHVAAAKLGITLDGPAVKATSQATGGYRFGRARNASG